MKQFHCTRTRILIVAGALLAAFCGVRSPCRAQPPDGGGPRPVLSLDDRPAAAPNAPPPDVAAADAVPISLPAALQLAVANNLDIAQARELINQAGAALLRARATILPNVNLGSTYVDHEGQIQRTEGNVITVNRDSLFVGGGPSLTLQTTDALFGPVIARDLVRATESASRRVNNDTLLAVADAYLNVLRARRRLARVDETLEFLTSERNAPSRAGAKGLLPLVRATVEAGGKEALRSDLARVEVEVLRRREERVAALQELRVAAAELARLIRLDPSVPLWPVEDFRTPLPLPGEGWMDRTIEELVAFAVGNRPEVSESQALAQAAQDRLRAAKVRPFMPNLSLNYAWGDFGGGPDPNPPIITPPRTPGGRPTITAQPGFGPSGRINHMKTRSDLELSVVWRLQNMGLGNLAEVREQQALQRQAQYRQVQAQDRVVTQVVQAREQVADWRERVAITRAALFDAQGKPDGPVFRGLKLNFDRIFTAEGRPLEVLDSIRGLNDLLEAYGTAMTDYERARIRLLVSLGVPPQTLLEEMCPAGATSASTPQPAKQ